MNTAPVQFSNNELPHELTKLRTNATGPNPLWPTDPVPCRDDLRYVAERYFKQTGEAAEIGVFRGDFSSKTLSVWTGSLTMIDAWQFRPNENAHDEAEKSDLDLPDKNWKDDATNLGNMDAARTHVKFAGDRAKLMRAFSGEAANKFSDGFFDWIYIDALHTRKAILNDLILWYPKVRRGGLISGDDYGERTDAELVTADRWAKTFGGVASTYNWGVITGVSSFTKTIGVDLHVTWLHDCYEFPAWYFVKP